MILADTSLWIEWLHRPNARAAGPDLAVVQIYREGRRHGFTIDCLIAAVAIEHSATILHKDRDYDMIARYTPLRVIRAIP